MNSAGTITQATPVSTFLNGFSFAYLCLQAVNDFSQTFQLRSHGASVLDVKFLQLCRSKESKNGLRVAIVAADGIGRRRVGISCTLPESYQRLPQKIFATEDRML